MFMPLGIEGIHHGKEEKEKWKKEKIIIEIIHFTGNSRPFAGVAEYCLQLHVKGKVENCRV
jgi:hypothetical protein